MTDIVLFWHRRDLRITDNVGLAAAVASGKTVIGLFCFDSQQFNRQIMAPASASYALESLKLLQQEYAAAGSELLILQGSCVLQIPAAIAKLRASALYFNELIDPQSQEIDRQIAAVLNPQGIAIHRYWDGLLHAPDSIYSGSGTPYTVYTPYWRNWQSRPKPEPIKALLLPAIPQNLQPQLAKLRSPLPDLTAHQLSWRRSQVLAPGTKAALERLEYFASKTIYSYGEDRNFPALDGTSTLSPALTWGTLGIRTVWQTTVQSMAQAPGIESQASVTTWRQELAWREFYHQALFHFPALLDGPYRSRWRNFPWSNDQERFERWCAGQTGYPIIDAAMTQLNETGWMHNRCRMIVASFLTKDLILNWQWGERYFMQTLVDGDAAANNGGWQWSASSGMDPKPLRIFNPSTQAQKFDPEGDYIRQWLPALKSVPLKELLRGDIAPLWRSKSGYPAPIVSHQIQQQEFKRLYSELKLEG